MPGCGKSTLGKVAAARLGWPFVDLDRRLELNARHTIPELISNKGEEYFRGLERTTLRSSVDEPAILATGGGAPAFFDNLDYMLDHGLVIYLHCPIPTLTQRLRHAKHDRPLLNAEDGTRLPSDALQKRLKHLYERRAEFYEQAPCKLLADGPLTGYGLAAVIADWYGL